MILVHAPPLLFLPSLLHIFLRRARKWRGDPFARLKTSRVSARCPEFAFFCGALSPPQQFQMRLPSAWHLFAQLTPSSGRRAILGSGHLGPATSVTGVRVVTSQRNIALFCAIVRSQRTTAHRPGPQTVSVMARSYLCATSRSQCSTSQQQPGARTPRTSCQQWAFSLWDPFVEPATQQGDATQLPDTAVDHSVRRSRVLADGSPVTAAYGHAFAKFGIVEHFKKALMPSSASAAVADHHDPPVVNVRWGGLSTRGVAASSVMVENWFIVLLAGFDIMGVRHEPAKFNVTVHDDDSDSCCKANVEDVVWLRLRHARTFLGWAPARPLLQSESSGTAVPGTRDHICDYWFPVVVRAALELDRMTTEVRQCTQLDVDTSAFVPMLLKHGSEKLTPETSAAPEAVLKCCNSVDAMRMLVALRRANVKPNLISSAALLSATKKPERWASALGIL